MKKLLVLTGLCLFTLQLSAQAVFQHVANSSVYEYLDEMAAMHFIEVNTVIRPWSRQFIAEKLLELNTDHRDELSSRQVAELDFFLKDYNKELIRYKDQFDKRLDLFYYADSNFTFSLNPIFGVNSLLNEGSYDRWFGVEFNSYISKRWGAYFSFRTNYQNEQLVAPRYLTQEFGGSIRNINGDDVEYSEMRGGLTYSWKWGHVGLVQDYWQWGNHQHGANIISGRAPVYPQLIIRLKPVRWLEFNSMHAWLNSNEVDSTATYRIQGGERIIYRTKFISANMLTITPVPRLDISVGNSTVYTDLQVHPGYLIPFFFHRPVDHTVSGNNNNAGQNSQLFFDISSRNLRYLQLYGTLFIDELKLDGFFDKETRRDQLSFKLGGNLYLPNGLGFTAEYTRNNRAAYRHYIPTQEFTSSDYQLGHYLGEDADELYLALSYRPIPRLLTRLQFEKVRKGSGTVFNGGNDATALPFLEDQIYELTEYGFHARYEYRNDISVFASVRFSDRRDDTGQLAPGFLTGEQTQIWLGANWGF